MDYRASSGTTARLVLLVALAITSAAAFCGEAVSGAGGVVVLSQDSYVRAFLAFRTPVQISKDGQVTASLEPDVPKGKAPAPIADFQSPLPPADWMKLEFDDADWNRQRSPVEMPPAWMGRNTSLHSATCSSIIYLRWKFAVDDPAQAKDLKLSVEYVGGLAAYVNGQELTRAHLAAGELRPDTLAEKYPDDLYCLEGGKMLQQPWPGEAVKKELIAAFERRYRKLDGVAVPAKLLRTGGNVLALAIHRAPTNEGAVGAQRTKEGAMYTSPGIWAYAALRSLSLASASGAGVVQNTARPKGVQVWNVAPFETLTAFDYGEPGEALRPIAIHSARNSVFSGRLAVGSSAAIKGLKVTVGGLKLAGGDGQLPASTVRVRYAEPAVPEKCWTPPHRFNGLLDAIPAEIPVIKAPPERERHLGQPIARPGVARGAVASLWLTARVPREAEAGRYEGVVTVEAEGLKPTAVPLKLAVCDWALPDPKDFRQHHLIFVAQEAVAKHYGVEMWSDKHFELMAKSLALLAEVNSREIPMNLAVNFYGGNKGAVDTSNEQSMVRWIKKADGSFGYDFTVFDKYCDLVARTIGKPFPLRLNCWGEVNKEGKNGSAAQVTCLDPATGKLEPMEQPLFGSEESYAFWKPVIDEALKKLTARGWLDVTALGHNSYCYSPQPQVVAIAKRLWPDGVWAYTAHNGTLTGRFTTKDKSVSMPVKYSVCIWTEGKLTPRGSGALLKPRPSIWCNTARTRHRDHSPLIVIRNLPEEMLLRGHDGVGDFGSDLFPLKKPVGTGYYCMGNGRGTGGPNDAERCILAPGPDGAVSTERFESLREGTELAEGILYLDRALQEKRISGELEQKVSRCLDERSEAFIAWYQRNPALISRAPADLAECDARLLALCAEVAAAAKGVILHRSEP